MYNLKYRTGTGVIMSLPVATLESARHYLQVVEDMYRYPRGDPAIEFILFDQEGRPVPTGWEEE